MSSHVDDIFGDNDDEEVPVMPKTTNISNQALVNDDFDIFESDDDDNYKNTNTGRKKVLGAKKKSKKSTSVVDSDQESPESTPKKKLGKKRSREEKNGKRKIRNDNKRKKSQKSGEITEPREQETGDEYDSGEEAVETKEDRDFIAAYDDQDIMGEYDGDQIFDDEKPISSKGSKSKRATGEQPKKSSGEKMILDQILGDYKGKKARDLTDGEKERIVDTLQSRMEAAFKKDEDCFAAHRPALNKFQLLPVVEQAVSMKSLSEKLMDRNILGSLVDWIEPKKDANKTLPALAVRSTIYKIIFHLPVTARHLTEIQRAPLGKIINALRKHPLETDENKRILKDISENWSRAISGNSEKVSFDSLHSSIENNPSLVRALAEKYSSTGSSTGTTKVDISSASNKVEVEDGQSRARVPISHGYLFTIHPSEKNITSAAGAESGAGEKRAILRKIVMEAKSKSSAGKKENPR